MGASPRPAWLPSRKLCRSWAVILGTSCPNRIPPCPLVCRASSAWDLVLHPPWPHTPRGGTASPGDSGVPSLGVPRLRAVWGSVPLEQHLPHRGPRWGAWSCLLAARGVGDVPPVLTHPHTPGASGKGYQLSSSPPKCHRCPRQGGELTAPPCCSSKPPQRRAKQLPGLALPWVLLKWSRELLTAPLGGCGLRRGLCTPRWAGARCRMGLRGGPSKGSDRKVRVVGRGCSSVHQGT